MDAAETYNVDPAKSRLAGMWMSEKKSTLTRDKCLLATRLLSGYLLDGKVTNL